MEKTNPPKIKIEITGDPTTGNVQVAGPLQLKEICVKLLATAIQIVMDHDKKAPNAPIEDVTGSTSEGFGLPKRREAVERDLLRNRVPAYRR